MGWNLLHVSRKQYTEDTTREAVILNYFSGNKVVKVTEMPVDFVTSNRTYFDFNVVVEKDRTGPLIKILNRGKACTGAGRQGQGKSSDATEIY